MSQVERQWQAGEYVLCAILQPFRVEVEPGRYRNWPGGEISSVPSSVATRAIANGLAIPYYEGSGAIDRRRLRQARNAPVTDLAVNR